MFNYELLRMLTLLVFSMMFLIEDLNTHEISTFIVFLSFFSTFLFYFLENRALVLFPSTIYLVLILSEFQIWKLNWIGGGDLKILFIMQSNFSDQSNFSILKLSYCNYPDLIQFFFMFTLFLCLERFLVKVKRKKKKVVCKFSILGSWLFFSTLISILV